MDSYKVLKARKHVCPSFYDLPSFALDPTSTLLSNPSEYALICAMLAGKAHISRGRCRWDWIGGALDAHARASARGSESEA